MAINRDVLARRLTDLFGFRSLASAIFRDPEDMADRLLDTPVSVDVPTPADGDEGRDDFGETLDNTDDEFDEDNDGFDDDDYVPSITLGEAEEVTAEAVRSSTQAMVRDAIMIKQNEVASDDRYNEVQTAFFADLTNVMTNAKAKGGPKWTLVQAFQDVRAKDQFIGAFEATAGWQGFVAYMREKMPMNGFDDMMRGHLEAVAIQSSAARDVSSLLSNRGSSIQGLAQFVMVQLARLTQEGMFQEAGEMAEQIATAYLALHREAYPA